MTTWNKIMALRPKDNRHKGVANTLDRDEIETLLATIDFFDGDVRQAYFDLTICRYRVFDWLAMGVMGGRIGSDSATKVLVHAFTKAKGDIDAFIADLRYTDYQVVTDWESIVLDT